MLGSGKIPHSWPSEPQLSLKIFNLPTGMKVYTVYCSVHVGYFLNLHNFGDIKL